MKNTTNNEFYTETTCELEDKEFEIKDIMLTAWGDNGAEGSLFSTLPVIVYYAESCYNDTVDDKSVDRVLRGLWGLSLEDFYSMDMLIVDKEQFEENYLFWKLPKMLLKLKKITLNF